MQLTLPSVRRVRIRYRNVPTVDDIVGNVNREMTRIYQGVDLDGADIVLTGPSRGIANCGQIFRAEVDWFKSVGAKPTILGAMGTHGGPDGSHILSKLAFNGITPESMDCPVEMCLETDVLGVIRESGYPLEVHCSSRACRARGVHLCNRLKRHTDMEGRHESGLHKVAAIGLGQPNGARNFHQQVFHNGLEWAIDQVVKLLIAQGKILGGLGIVENQYHKLGHLKGFTPGELDEGEAEWLAISKALMPLIPLPIVDISCWKRAGKNVSGTGLDTKTLQRGVYGYITGQRSWNVPDPPIWRVYVCTLTPESEGNAVGMGLWDGISERFFRMIDFDQTNFNGFTGVSAVAPKLPRVFPNDRAALEAMLRLVPYREEGPIFVGALDTNHLTDLLMSPAGILRLEREAVDADIEVEGDERPILFDGDGNFAETFLGE